MSERSIETRMYEIFIASREAINNTRIVTKFILDRVSGKYRWSP